LVDWKAAALAASSVDHWAARTVVHWAARLVGN
jgi:hypothetical protein